MAERTPASPMSAGDAVAFGWRLVWKRPESIAVLLVGGILGQVVALPGTIVAIALEASGERELELAALFVRAGSSLVNLPFSVFFALGVLRYTLNLARGAPAGFRDLFVLEWGLFGHFLLATILMTLAMGVGLLFCILPGLFLALCWMFTGLALVDRRLPATDAMSFSWNLTRGQRMNLVLLVLLLFGVNVLGLLACCVGIFITSPMTYLAMAWAYLRLTGQETAEA